MISKKKNEDFTGKVIFNKYKCLSKLGEGSFGSIYEAECEGKKYALKIEDKANGQGLLEQEAYVMSYLKGGKK